MSFDQRVGQLVLAPINGTYGLQNQQTGFAATDTVGRLFGQIGVIVFIMAIGAFISVSFATRSVEMAVAALANRLRTKGWLLIAAVMVLFSLLGSTMGFSVLVITGLAFALMTFAVIPWSSIFGATTGPADDLVVHATRTTPYCSSSTGGSPSWRCCSSSLRSSSGLSPA
jgi:uncharacterized ion transporter superfamily protein YfcC